MRLRFNVWPATLFLALVVPAVSLDCNSLAGIDEPTLRTPDAGAGGAGGAGGAAGGASGRGGAAGSGAAGGAAGGAAACAGDAACLGERGLGSLCVAGTCTEPASACDASLLAVVDAARDASAEPALASGCFYRSLDDALTASLAGSAKRLAVFADAVTSARDVLVAAGVSLEGYASSGGAPVKLTVNATPGQPLVSLSAGASLRGFALDGGGVNNVIAVATLGGGASLAGPLRIERASVGLDARSISGANSVTVVGSAGAPVVFSDNVQAITQGSALSLTGDGAAGGLVIENSKVAGVTARSAKLVIDGVVVRGHAAGPGVRSEQVSDVVVKNSVFVQNETSILLAGDNVNGSGFDGVVIADNDFTDAVLPGPTGSVICGVDVITGTALHLPGVNRFPGGRLCSTTLKGTCGGGVDVGAYSATTFDVQCQ